MVVTTADNAELVEDFLGEKIDMEMQEWEKLDNQLITRRIMITKSKLNGKYIGELKLRSGYGVNMTRVNRAGRRPDPESQPATANGRPRDGRRLRSGDQRRVENSGQFDAAAQRAEPDPDLRRHRARRAAGQHPDRVSRHPRSPSSSGWPAARWSYRS